jgi:hypothetical protein
LVLKVDMLANMLEAYAAPRDTAGGREC